MLHNLNLVYYDALGAKLSTPVASPDLIQMIEINIRVEDVYGYDTANDGKEDLRYVCICILETN